MIAQLNIQDKATQSIIRQISNCTSKNDLLLILRLNLPNLAYFVDIVNNKLSDLEILLKVKDKLIAFSQKFKGRRLMESGFTEDTYFIYFGKKFPNQLTCIALPNSFVSAWREPFFMILNHPLIDDERYKEIIVQLPLYLKENGAAFSWKEMQTIRAKLKLPEITDRKIFSII